MKKQELPINSELLYSVVEKAKRYDALIRPFPDKLLHCSFCGKSQGQVKELIAGDHVYICNECVALCNDVLADSGRDQTVVLKEVDGDKTFPCVFINRTGDIWQVRLEDGAIMNLLAANWIIVDPDQQTT